MKYLVVIANGLTDRPIAEKDNKTPLQLADTPNLDQMVREGYAGSVQTIPESLHTRYCLYLTISYSYYIVSTHS